MKSSHTQTGMGAFFWIASSLPQVPIAVPLTEGSRLLYGDHFAEQGSGVPVIELKILLDKTLELT